MAETAARVLQKKRLDSQKIIAEAFDRYPRERLAVAWTGGKDSTLVLFLVRDVCRNRGLPLPPCFCIDEGDVFDEIRAFIEEWRGKWDVPFEWIHNDNVSRAAGGRLGARVRVADLDEGNRREIERLGYEEEEFPYEPESFVGNHLMKTVALNRYLQRCGILAFFEGIRWDEQASRANEQYFSPRAATPYSPEHVRICPILHFSERDVWEAHFAWGIPVCGLYERGYRSLGARVSTTRHSDVPAWEQDLENTHERGGRRQDKEELMEKLRKLGYM